MDEPATVAFSARTDVPEPPAPKRRVTWVAALAAAVLIGGIAGGIGWKLRSDQAAPSPNEAVATAIHKHFELLRNEGFAATVANSCGEVKMLYQSMMHGHGARPNQKHDISVVAIENVTVHGAIATASVTGTEQGRTDTNTAKLAYVDGAWRMCTLPE